MGEEFKIPNTRFSVDGYCKETNTIYEFYGDVFHGNPKMFPPNEKCHPYNKDITAEMLYEKTIIREDYLRQLGYEVVTIWESDYA